MNAEVDARILLSFRRKRRRDVQTYFTGRDSFERECVTRVPRALSERAGTDWNSTDILQDCRRNEPSITNHKHTRFGSILLHLDVEEPIQTDSAEQPVDMIWC